MYTFNKIANNWKADKMANNYGYAVKGFDFNIEEDPNPRQEGLYKQI